jgi:hypothetical protein
MRELLTDEEERQWKDNPAEWKRPKDAVVSLGQHRYGPRDRSPLKPRKYRRSPSTVGVHPAPSFGAQVD